MSLFGVAGRMQRRGEFSRKPCGTEASGVDARDLHAGLRQQFSAPQCALFEHEVRASLFADAGGDRELIVEACRPEVVDGELCNDELQSRFLSQPRLLNTERAQPFSAATLEKLEKVGVVDDPTRVGVLEVHAQLPFERASFARGFHGPRVYPGTCALAAKRAATGPYNPAPIARPGVSIGSMKRMEAMFGAGRFARMARFLPIFVALLWLGACSRVTNNPHPAGSERTNTFYTAFQERSPRYLDPTASYNLDETPYTYSV